MRARLSREERLDIINMKCAAQYMDEKHRKLRYDMKKLAEAWMKYIDYLGLDYYLPRHFNDDKLYPVYKDIMFTNGERSKITKYMKEKKLITVDAWKRHIVEWRKKG